MWCLTDTDLGGKIAISAGRIKLAGTGTHSADRKVPLLNLDEGGGLPSSWQGVVGHVWAGPKL